MKNKLKNAIEYIRKMDKIEQGGFESEKIRALYLIEYANDVNETPVKDVKIQE